MSSERTKRAREQDEAQPEFNSEKGSIEEPVPDIESLGEKQENLSCELHQSDPQSSDRTNMTESPARLNIENEEQNSSIPEKDVQNGPPKNVICVEGCAHGELETIYASIAEIEKKHNVSVKLLICCGDFESIRNNSDLHTMACPVKYRHINSFWKYYSGENTAPVTTLFIGGNHESTAYLHTLPYGGFVAPNIYYMGRCGSVYFGGLRIAGISGIYKEYNYRKGHFETPPFNEDNKRSVYHQREEDVFRLSLLRGDIDVMFSHDWPNGIEQFGNVQKLLRIKKHFAEDINANKLGSPALLYLLNTLQPKYFFSAHLHCFFPAVVKHKNSTGENNGKITKFLALDKVIPGRQFLQVLDIGLNDDFNLRYDPEFLCILKATHFLSNVTKLQEKLPWDSREKLIPKQEDIEKVKEEFGPSLKISTNVVKTQPLHDGSKYSERNSPAAPVETSNPYTEHLLSMLSLPDCYSSEFVEFKRIRMDEWLRGEETTSLLTSASSSSLEGPPKTNYENPEEINLDDL